MRANPNSYDIDVIAWANEQARLLRAGRFDALDIEHIADEIEDVGKSEKRELASRMAVLLAHMLKWQYQPGGRGNSWQRTIKEQRNRVGLCIDQTPSLKAELRHPLASPSPMNAPIDTLRLDLRTGLSEIYGPRLKGLFLFGSYARGQAQPESDLDLLVVLDQIDRYGAEIDRTGHLASRLSLEYGITISRVFVSALDWKERTTPFFVNVRAEAVAA